MAPIIKKSTFRGLKKKDRAESGGAQTSRDLGKALDDLENQVRKEAAEIREMLLGISQKPIDGQCMGEVKQVVNEVYERLSKMEKGILRGLDDVESEAGREYFSKRKPTSSTSKSSVEIDSYLSQYLKELRNR